MPIPPYVLARVFTYIVRTAPRAYNHAGRVIEKFVSKKLGTYVVEIERRSEIGKDGGISQVVRVLRNDVTQETWHLVVKAGRIIHKHLKP